MTIQPTKKQSRRLIILEGLLYGFIMYLIMTFIYPAIFDDVEVSFKSVIWGIPIWLVAGLCYSWLKILVIHGFTTKATNQKNT
jgi:hypothetical protein